jgi:pimeloyl-ACP methyl ester carboxylesterase
MADLRDNPLAVPGSDPPRIVRPAVNGTTLYAEVRGAGPVVLLIPGGAEDAEGWRPVAERLSGHTVVTYDRRGTLRSGRKDWPGQGSAQHAADASALLAALGLRDAVVFGGSSAGIIALQMALRHPTVVRHVLAFEPGYFHEVPDGPRLHASVVTAMTDHIDGHPGDWVGAYRAFVKAATPANSPEGEGFLTAPVNEWYARREEMEAEPFVRDNVPVLTRERVDRVALASAAVEIRFSHGTRSSPIFHEIAASLAGVRGTEPDVIDGVDHACYLEPNRIAAYIRRRRRRRS